MDVFTTSRKKWVNNQIGPFRRSPDNGKASIAKTRTLVKAKTKEYEELYDKLIQKGPQYDDTEVRDEIKALKIVKAQKQDAGFIQEVNEYIEGMSEDLTLLKGAYVKDNVAINELLSSNKQANEVLSKQVSILTGQLKTSQDSISDLLARVKTLETPAIPIEKKDNKEAKPKEKDK